MASKTDQLFAAEAALRSAAHSYACGVSSNASQTHADRNVERRRLREAAIAYAKLAIEIDDCFDGSD